MPSTKRQHRPRTPLKGRMANTTPEKSTCDSDDTAAEASEHAEALSKDVKMLYELRRLVTDEASLSDESELHELTQLLFDNDDRAAHCTYTSAHLDWQFRFVWIALKKREGVSSVHFICDPHTGEKKVCFRYRTDDIGAHLGLQRIGDLTIPTVLICETETVVMRIDQFLCALDLRDEMLSLDTLNRFQLNPATLHIEIACICTGSWHVMFASNGDPREQRRDDTFRAIFVYCEKSGQFKIYSNGCGGNPFYLLSVPASRLATYSRWPAAASEVVLKDDILADIQSERAGGGPTCLRTIIAYIRAAAYCDYRPADRDRYLTNSIFDTIYYISHTVVSDGKLNP